MNIRVFAIATALSVFLSVFSTGIASGQEPDAPEVPPAPNIVDPEGDANHHSFLTGQGGGSLTGADILAVWFTNDVETFQVHLQTASGSRPDSVTFDVSVDPGAGAHCVVFRLITAGSLNDASSKVTVSAACGEASGEGEISEAAGPDGTSIITASFPRSVAAEVFADGKILQKPAAVAGWNFHEAGERGGIIDDTDLGSDYPLASGPADEDPPGDDPPGDDPPGDDPPGEEDPPQVEDPDGGNSDEVKDKKKKCKKKKTKKAKKKCRKRKG